MLIEPASKVSVPFTVVMRTAVKAAASEIEPPVTEPFDELWQRLPEDVQILLFKLLIVIKPPRVSVFAVMLEPAIPVVIKSLAIEPTANLVRKVKYPVVV